MAGVGSAVVVKNAGLHYSQRGTSWKCEIKAILKENYVDSTRRKTQTTWYWVFEEICRETGECFHVDHQRTATEWKVWYEEIKMLWKRRFSLAFCIWNALPASHNKWNGLPSWGSVGDAGYLFPLEFLGQGMYQKENIHSFACWNILWPVKELKHSIFFSVSLCCFFLFWGGRKGGFTFCI